MADIVEEVAMSDEWWKRAIRSAVREEETFLDEEEAIGWIKTFGVPGTDANEVMAEIKRLPAHRRRAGFERYKAEIKAYQSAR